MQNVDQTIISQYANSRNLVALIENLNAYIDPSVNISAFYNSIMNITSATGYGLDVWGRIVGVGRVVLIPLTTPFFGFFEALPYSVGFGQGPFWGGSAVLTQAYNLPDAQYQTLIFAKALANICDGAIPAINQILLNLFPGRGNCYVTDGLDMTMTYTFDFALTNTEVAILSQSGALPKPTGVSALVVQL